MNLIKSKESNACVSQKITNYTPDMKTLTDFDKKIKKIKFIQPLQPFKIVTANMFYLS